MQPIVDVIEQIARILSEHGYEDNAAWLLERAEVLRSPTTPSEDIRQTLDELHSIVTGMGGLFDLRLEDGAHQDATAARVALDELADRLFELTR